MFPLARVKDEGTQVRSTIDYHDEGDSEDRPPRSALHFTPHAYERIRSRGLSTDDVIAAIAQGVIVEDYGDERPYPTRLLLIRREGRPLHVVVSERRAQGVILVVTAYEPSPDQWYPGFRRRR